MDVFLLVAGLVSVAFVANGLSPRRGRWSRLPSFFASWFTIELSLHWLAAIAVVAIVGINGGGLGSLWGTLGLILLLAAAAGLLAMASESRRTGGTMRGVAAEMGRAIEPVPPKGPVVKASGYPASAVAFPVLMGRRRGVQRLRNLTYGRVAGRTLTLDLTMPARARPGDQRPVLLYLHGGAWFTGDKGQQGLPMLNHLAADGWVGVNANYRLSPAATFPDHLVDAKRALAWIRSHIADYGGDPGNVSVAGASAGGHLATMMGLTANHSGYQPGFEAVDTSVRGAVSLYGVYDLTNRLGTWPPTAMRRIVESWFIKAFLEDEPDRFTAASPIDKVSAGAAPMLIVHGNRDTLTPVEDARLFAQRLRAVSGQPVLYAELPGAQHAFDLFPSVRAARVVEGVERFLVNVAG